VSVHAVLCVGVNVEYIASYFKLVKHKSQIRVISQVADSRHVYIRSKLVYVHRLIPSTIQVIYISVSGRIVSFLAFTILQNRIVQNRIVQF